MNHELSTSEKQKAQQRSTNNQTAQVSDTTMLNKDENAGNKKIK